MHTDPRFDPAVQRRLGLVGMQFVMWVSALHKAWLLDGDSFWHATLRYEELLAHREGMVNALMKQLYGDQVPQVCEYQELHQLLYQLPTFECMVIALAFRMSQ